MINSVWIAADLKDQWELIEQYAVIPLSDRLNWLAEQVDKKKIVILGETEKTASELATDCIKKGVKARSYTDGKVRHDKNNRTREVDGTK
jgi:hypothetical protein